MAAAAGILLLAAVTALFSLRTFPPSRTSGLEQPLPLQPTPASSQAGAPIVVNWTTKSEVNTAGFNLYRAQSAGGPFTQLNRELIPAGNDPIAGGSYVYTDTNVVAGVTYYYQLEDVDVNGTRTRYDKLITVTASAPAESVFGVSFPIAATAVAGLMLMALGLILWRVRRT